MATQTLTVDEYLRLPYQIALTRGEGEDAPWTATISELPGAEATGRTPEEASARVLDAMAAWFENALAEGRTIPPPATELSGRLLVRMPRTRPAAPPGAAGAPGPAVGTPEAPPRSRLLRVALVADLVLVAVAAVAAVVLLAGGN